MTAFTPGPWRVDPEYPRDIQTADGGLEIASTADSILAEGIKPDAATQRANAHLIAAAPLMFAAMQKLDAVAKKMSDFESGWGYDTYDEVTAELRQALKDVREALAAADPKESGLVTPGGVE